MGLTTETTVIGRCEAPKCTVKRYGSKDEPPVGCYGTVEAVHEDVDGVHSVLIRDLFGCTGAHLKKAIDAALAAPWDFGAEQITYSEVEMSDPHGPRTIYKRERGKAETAGEQANNAPAVE